MSTRHISRLLSRSYTSFQLSTSSYLSAFLNTYNPISPRSGNSRRFTTPKTASSSIDLEVHYWYAYLPPTQEELEIGRDYEHWFVEVDEPESDKSRDEIIDSYVKTLATVVGSEEEARMKIYSVSTRCYYAFGALVSVEHSYKLNELPHVRSVEPDSYLCVTTKDYGGEPFIKGKAVPYDPKYHKVFKRLHNECPDTDDEIPEQL